MRYLIAHSYALIYLRMYICRIFAHVSKTYHVILLMRKYTHVGICVHMANLRTREIFA